MDAGTIAFNKSMLENAEKSTGMGGKRFLGWTAIRKLKLGYLTATLTGQLKDLTMRFNS